MLLVLYYWSTIFFMLNKHTPFPICSLAKESIFTQRACRGTRVLQSFPHEQCGYLGSYRDLFPFLAVLSTILFNIKIPQVSFLILFHSFMSLPTRTKVVPFFFTTLFSNTKILRIISKNILILYVYKGKSYFLLETSLNLSHQPNLLFLIGICP